MAVVQLCACDVHACRACFNVAVVVVSVVVVSAVRVCVCACGRVVGVVRACVRACVWCVCADNRGCCTKLPLVRCTSIDLHSNLACLVQELTMGDDEVSHVRSVHVA